jgi:hypothetical protein
LIFSDWAAEKHRHLREACRWCVGHEIGHLSIERAIDDHTQGTLAWVMLGNEKHGAPEVRIEHIWMSHQQ